MVKHKISQEAEEIDREVCAEATCYACGHAGLRYIPRWNGSVYAPVSKCPKCKEEVEF